MKILVFNIPNTLNYGSMMMAETLFYHLSKSAPGQNLEFIVVTPEPEETVSRLSRALGDSCRRIKIIPILPLDVIRGRKIPRIISQITGIGFKTRLAPIIQDIDGLIILGGDDYTEDYGYFLPVARMLKIYGFSKAGTKVIMCGQTIGPFKSWRKNVMRNLLRSITRIYVREPITYRYLREEFQLQNVTLSADLAFLNLAGECKMASNCTDVTDKQYFTVVPSEMIWNYGLEMDRDSYLNMLTSVALKLLAVLPDSRLIILPHVVNPDINDDTLAGRDLYIKLKRKGVNSSRLIFIRHQLLPCHARKILSGSQLVLTGRMHAALSSFSCGVPAVSLSYSRKYWGIIGEYFAMSELLIDVRKKPWDVIGKIIEQKIEHVLSNRKIYSETIQKKAVEMRNIALESVEEINKILLNKTDVN